jgi:hypothetical protein
VAWKPEGAASAASHSLFSGQRHVVSGAAVWRRELKGNECNTINDSPPVVKMINDGGTGHFAAEAGFSEA